MDAERTACCPHACRPPLTAFRSPPRQKRVNDAPDLRLDFSHRSTGAHYFDSLRLLPRQSEISRASALLKFQPFGFKSAVPRLLFGGTPQGASKRHAWRKVEHNRQVRLCSPADDPVKRTDDRQPQLAPVTLVSQRRIIEAIAHHELTPGESGPHNLIQVLRASGIHQNEFGKGRGRTARCASPVSITRQAGRQENAPDLLAHVRSTRLARRSHSVSALLEVIGKHSELRGLPGAVNSLERDEEAALQSVRPLSVVSRPWSVVSGSGLATHNLSFGSPPHKTRTHASADDTMGRPPRCGQSRQTDMP